MTEHTIEVNNLLNDSNETKLRAFLCLKHDFYNKNKK